MFLGKDDIQFGVNESLRDTATVISSMVSTIVARVAAHDDIAELAKHSTVPVINALSDDYHPLQAITDCLTMYETAIPLNEVANGTDPNTLALKGKKIAWVGDANNVLFDLAIAAGKLGIDLSVATPTGYGIPDTMLANIEAPSPDAEVMGKLIQTNDPYEAVKDADYIFTDTWISMGQEAERAERIKAFEGFQVTEELARKGGYVYLRVVFASSETL